MANALEKKENENKSINSSRKVKIIQKSNLSRYMSLVDKELPYFTYSADEQISVFFVAIFFNSCCEIDEQLLLLK